MNRGLLLAGVAALLLVLIALSWSAHRSGHTAPLAHATGLSPRRAKSASPTQRPALDPGRLLPFTPGQITHAAQLAEVFVCAYSTRRYNEPPAAYLRRLAPMVSPSLYAVLERTETDPTVQLPRQRTQEITLAEGHTEAIRELGPDSITFLVTATEHITTTYTTRHDTTRYAVTLTPTTDGHWTVYDVELAASGQAGDSGAIP